MATLLFFPQYILAESKFDPNYLISDSEIQNWQSMNRSDIQAFLEEKNGAIQSLRAMDVNQTTRKISDIIYQASKEYKINPKYLLVKLQKEQSLITEKNPTQKQLDWATGYGASDGIPLDDPSIAKHKGIGIQIDSAAGIIRWYYEHVGTEPWIKTAGKTYNIDDKEISPSNNATAFLYTYTPHLHGNKNFWNLWQTWFEQVYPDGSLVHVNGEPTVYLIQDGKKRPFTSMTALVTRYDPKLILTIPKSELSRYEDSTKISLPNYSIVKTDEKYYLLDFDTARPFISYEVVQKMGYNPDEIIDITSEDLKNYTIKNPIEINTTNPLGKLVRVKENNTIYYLNENEYRPIYDDIIAKINYPNLKIEKGNSKDLQSYESGPTVLLKDGTVFGVEGNSKIFVMEKGKKRHIASEDIFNGLGFDWKNIIWINQFSGTTIEIGEPIYLRAKIEINQNNTSTTTINNSIVTGSSSTPKADNSTSISDLMVRTPKDQTEIIGKEFDTDVDTYLIADYDTEEILAGKNVNTIRSTASLAKVMTAYMLIKEGINENSSVIYSVEKHKTPPEFHKYRIAEGEKVLKKDLLDALLVSSLNTPARMLAETSKFGEEKFIAGMNKQAIEWGLTKTNFIDSYGGSVYNETTALEYLTIFKKTTSNSTVRSHIEKKYYAYDEILDKDKMPSHFDYHTNELLKETDLPFGIIASKTGFIYEAGDNLAMIVERKTDQKRFVIITMGNPDHDNKSDEPRALAIWAMNQF